jgi:hypothetical protein
MDKVRKQTSSAFSRCRVDIRPPFFDFVGIDRADPSIAHRLASITISEVKQPFERQPPRTVGELEQMVINEQQFIACPELVTNLLYDGFMMQRVFSAMLPEDERIPEHLHIIFTGKLACTFSEDDWRYHARALVCGTPSIISTSGIVEAPAKPREFYLYRAQAHYLSSQREATRDRNTDGDKDREFAGQYIDYYDKRITDAAIGYVYQATMFFITFGRPFCNLQNCRLYNSHWQSDLIRTQVLNPVICKRHKKLIDDFNKSVI